MSARLVDLLLVGLLVVAAFAISAWLDLFEAYHRWSRPHEGLDVDELVMVAVAAVPVEVSEVLPVLQAARTPDSESAAATEAERRAPRREREGIGILRVRVT